MAQMCVCAAEIPAKRMEMRVGGRLNSENKHKGLVIQGAGVGRQVTEDPVDREICKTNLSLLQGQPDTAKQREREPKLAVWFWIIDTKTQWLFRIPEITPSSQVYF